MTELIRTGRILDWFVKDLKRLAREGVTFRELPLSVDPYRPPGVYAFTPCGPGRPVLWHFPQPLHPIEAIAALRGFGPASPAGVEAVQSLAFRRALPWRDYTVMLSHYLFVNPPTVRLVWQMLTPFKVPPYPPGGNLIGWGDGAEDECTALWRACGFAPTKPGMVPWMKAHLSYIWPPGKQVAERKHFWTELDERIEL